MCSTGSDGVLSAGAAYIDASLDANVSSNASRQESSLTVTRTGHGLLSPYPREQGRTSVTSPRIELTLDFNNNSNSNENYNHINITGNLAVIGLVRVVSFKKMLGAMRICSYFKDGMCGIMVLAKTMPAGTSERLGDNFFYVKEPISMQQLLRTYRLATLRNMLIKKALKRFPTFEHFLQVDLDGIVRWDNITARTVLDALRPSRAGQWDGIAFASEPYYDWWALRCSGKSVSCRADHSCFNRRNFPCLQHAQRKGAEGLVQVDSAFGGLAIYRRRALEDCRYTASDDCEHVSFNRCMKQKGMRFMLSGAGITIPPMRHR